MSIELDPITSGFNLSKINNNFDKVENELNNNVLRRDGLSTGEPNQMEVNLDMNSHAILNAVTDTTDDGSLVTWGQFKRAFKAPLGENPLDAPNAADRANKVFAWNNAGDPIAVLPQSGSATDVLIELAKPTGTNNIGYNANTLTTKLGEFVSIQDYMTPAQIADANSATPVLNHSAALVAALAVSKVVYFPPVKGNYLIGNVALPTDTVLWGNSSKPYTASSINSVRGRGSVICIFPGSASIFTMGLHVELHNLVFWGGGSGGTIDFLQRTTPSIELQRLRFYSCGFYGFRIACGNVTLYTKELELYECNIANNNTGIRNTIDSKVFGGFINANTGDGVRQLTGANDNIYVGVKNEFNGGSGYSFTQAKHCLIVGGIVDRSGSAGISNNGAQVIIDGVWMRRNGANALGTPQCAHIYSEAVGTQLIVSNVDTETGVNDDGSGNNTPQYGITTAGASTDTSIQVSNCNFSGALISGLNAVTGSLRFAIRNNININDTVTVGVNRTSNGSDYVSRALNQAMTSSPITIPLTQTPVTTFSRNPTRELEIVVRNTSTGGSEWFLAKVLFPREGGSATASFLTEQTVPAGRISSTSGVVVATIAITSVDGSTFDLTLTPSDSISRSVSVWLR